MNRLFKNLKTMALALIGLVAFLTPQSALAGGAMANSVGVSDESLFMILVLVAGFQLLAIVVIAGVIKSIVSNKEVWQNRWGKGAAVLTTLFVLTSSQSFAADADFDALVTLDDTAFMALVTLNLFLFVAFIYLATKLNGLMRALMADADGKVPETFMDKINTMLTDAVPVEREGDVMMDHEYDGIRELDNNLPPWWLYGFYFTIVFGIAYIVVFHVTKTSDLQIAEYHAEVEAAEAAKEAFVATQENVVDESNVELLTDATALANGAKSFKLYCAACHGESGGSSPGGVGPNLTDDYWIHGGTVTDVFKTIKYGVPSKGMVSWEAQLNPTQIQEVSSFIISLKGTNPPNAKEAQGELVGSAESADAAPAEGEEEAPAETETAE